MKKPPRLITDVRRRFVIKTLTIVAVAFAVVFGGLCHYSAIKEKRRQERLEICRTLKEKSDCLVEKVTPLRYADDLKHGVDDVRKRLDGKDGVAVEDVDLVQQTRVGEAQLKSFELAMSCSDIIAELSEMYQRLSVLVTEGEGIEKRMRAFAESSLVKEVEAIRDKSEESYSNLKRMCDEHVVFSPDCQALVEECGKIIGSIEDMQNGSQELKLFDKACQEYETWFNNVKELVGKLNRREVELQETYRKLKAIPLDRGKTLEHVQMTINNSLNELAPFIARGTDALDNSRQRIESMLSARQETAQEDYETIACFRALHGDYVSENQIESARMKLEEFQSFYRQTMAKVDEFCHIINDNLAKAKKAQLNAKNLLDSMSIPGELSSDEQVMKNYKEGQALSLDLEGARRELEKNLESMAGYVLSKQKEADLQVNGINELMQKIKMSFPDWEPEGRKVAGEIAEIRPAITLIRKELEAFSQKLDDYRDSGTIRGTMNSLRRKLSRILVSLGEIEEKLEPINACSNGNELIGLKRQNEKLKGLVEAAEQMSRRLDQELERAIHDGRLARIKYVPYANQLASLLQKGKRRFDFMLNIPGEGRHKLEIRFRKTNSTLYKLSPKKNHLIEMACHVSGVMDKKGQWRWKDQQGEWPGNVTIVGECQSGKNDFSMSLIFKAVNYEGIQFPNGTWQFQVNGSSGVRDRFFVEFLVDGVPSDDVQIMDNGNIPDHEIPRQERQCQSRHSPIQQKDSFPSLLELGDDVVLQMIKVKAGSFIMGSPKNELGRNSDEKQHKVKLTRDYWLGATEVTQGQWKAVMGRNPSYFAKGDEYPVEKVSLDDALEFCNALNRKYSDRLPPGYKFSLPTEAQWEYACRAGTTTALNNGRNLTDADYKCSALNEIGWYNYKNKEFSTHPVARKRPNAWGFYDMHGNVWEWCRDRYGNYNIGEAFDPIGANGGSSCIRRGGSWRAFARRCRAALRSIGSPFDCNDDLGFRLALVPIP